MGMLKDERNEVPWRLYFEKPRGIRPMDITEPDALEMHMQIVAPGFSFLLT